MKIILLTALILSFSFPVLSQEQDEEHYQLGNRTIVYNHNGKYGLKNATGKIIFPAKFDKIYQQAAAYEFFKVEINNKTGMVDEKGRIIIPIGKYDDVSIYIGRVLNQEGTEILFKFKIFEIIEKGKIGFVDTTGNVLFKPQFDSIAKRSIDPNLNVSMIVKKDGNWGEISGNGEVTAPFEHKNYNELISPTPIKQIDTSKVKKIIPRRRNDKNEINYCPVFWIIVATVIIGSLWLLYRKRK